MVREDLYSTSSSSCNNSRRQMSKCSTPKYEKRRGKSADRGLNNRPSAPHSVSSLMNSEAGSSKMSAGSMTPPSNDAPLYEKLIWSHQYDPKSKEDVVLHRRVGFYRFKADIGSGNFSKVKLAHHQLTKEKVAVKVIDKSKLDGKTQKMVTREINIMDSLSHPNLIRLFEVTETVSGIYLMMEYAPGGELFVRLAENGSFTEHEAKPIFAQIASAVDYMHGRNFIHRDLKAENVFFAVNYPVTTTTSTTKPSSAKSSKNGFVSPVSFSSSRADNVQVKVGDFGFATQVNKIDQHLTTFCGSPPYAAPELFQDDHYFGPSVDIWALGILLYLMVTGSMPFKGTTVAELKNAILDGHFEMPDYLSQNCIDLIAGILKRRSDWRLTLAQIRQSPWLSGIHWPLEDGNFHKLPCRQSQIDDGTEDSVNNGETKALELTRIETKTRQALEEIGIDKTLLESHIERGPRSHIIGAFRIIQNKLLLAEQKSDEIESMHSTNGTIWSPTKSWSNGRSTQGTPSEELHAIKHVDSSRLTSPTSYNNDSEKPKKNKKSKLCLIL